MLGELQTWSGWTPWPIDPFRKETDDLFNHFFFGDGEGRNRMLPTTRSPSVDTFVRDGKLVVHVDLPGVEPKDINVSAVGNTLTIQASRERHRDERSKELENKEVSYIKFERSITMPEAVDSQEIKATYQHGVLELTIPIKLAGRKIPIEIAKEETRQLERQAA